MSANYSLLQHYCQPWDYLLNGYLDVIALCDHALLATFHNLTDPIPFQNSNTCQRVSSAVPRSYYLACLVGLVGIEPTLNRL